MACDGKQLLHVQICLFARAKQFIMPAVNLTLRLDQKVIELGKRFAKEQGTSLSKLVEQFLEEQTAQLKRQPIVVEPDPDVLALMLKSSGEKHQSNRDIYDEYADSIDRRRLNSIEEE